MSKSFSLKLSDFKRVRSHVLQCYESSGRQRNGNNDNLVPVTFPVKAVFPHTQKRLKPLLASLELRWDSNENFGMPKGGLDTPCSLVFSRVHCVLEICYVLFVLCYFLSLKFVGVAVRVAVQRLMVQQCLML